MRGETWPGGKIESTSKHASTSGMEGAKGVSARAGASVARAESPRPADCIERLSESCSFSKHGGNSVDGRATERTLSRGEAADPRPGAATTSQCDGKSNREERAMTCQPRAWSEGARFRLTRKSHNILTWIHVAIITQLDDKKLSDVLTMRDPNGRHSDAPARRPRPICSRITSSTPHVRARGAARSTGHWLKNVCPASYSKVVFRATTPAFSRPERTRPRAPSPPVIRASARTMMTESPSSSRACSVGA